MFAFKLFYPAVGQLKRYILRFELKKWSVACVWILLSSCQQSIDNDINGRIFRYAVGDPIASLDPVHASLPTTRMLVGSIYDTLFRFQYLARPYQISLGLAAGFPKISEDGLSYEITLREGVLFHADPAISNQQREVTANDVAYSLLRHFDPTIKGQGAWLWSHYIVGVDDWGRRSTDYDQLPAGVQVLDRYRLKITLSQPYADFLQTLALPVAAIVSKQVVEHYGQEYPLNPIGSGPYQLQRFSTGLVLLRANLEYRQETIQVAELGYIASDHQSYGLARLEGLQLPLVGGIEVRYIRDGQQRWQQLQDGLVDGMQLPAPLYSEVLAAVEPVSLQSVWADTHYVNRQPLAQLYKIDFNMADIRLGDVGTSEQREFNHALRCKLRDSFDWDGYNDLFFDRTGYVFNGVLAPVASNQVFAEEHSAQMLLFDANQHLPQIDYGYSDSDLNQRIFTHFQASLVTAGYPKDLLVAKPYVGFSAFAEAYSQRRLPLVHTGWALDYPSTLNTLQLYTSENLSPGPGVANYRNPSFDQWYALIHAGTEQRQELEQQMQQQLRDDCVTIAGFSPAQVHVWSKQFIAYPDSEFASGDLLRYVMPTNHTEPSTSR